MSPQNFFRVQPIESNQIGVGARGIRMPIDILLSLPDYIVTSPESLDKAFNLPGAISILLENHAEIASQMLRPHVWAPGMDKNTLNEFSEKPVQGRVPPRVHKRLRAGHFPGQANQPAQRKDYEIVHFYGQVTPQGDLISGEAGAAIPLASLRDGLGACHARLFIFDAIDQENFENASALNILAENLGIAVLRVYTDNHAVHEDYFMDLYANILHNRPLPKMAEPAPWQESELQIELTYPQDNHDLLNFDRWMDTLEKRLLTVEKRIERINRKQDRISGYAPMLHNEQMRHWIDKQVSKSIDSSSSKLRESLETIRKIREVTWDHERDGAAYLPEMAQAVRMVESATLEADYSLPASSAIQAEIRNAPRVLNANFAEASGRVVPLNEALQAGEDYSLLVDIGPRWNRIPNLLGENAEFPEQGIGELISPEEKEQGWFDLEAVFVSEQFSPNLVSARMRVPLLPVGRSLPYLQGALVENPGPLKLTVTAPQLPEGSQALRAHGRLCLYYGAQVIQSAVLEVGVQAGPGQQQETPNSGLVDYVLTPGFRAVEQQIATRYQGEGEEPAPVKIGLMLNDDLSGSHRLLLKMHDAETETTSLPPAWKTYSPGALQSILERARAILVNPAGQNLAGYNSETFLLDKFKDDLTALATLGAELRSILLQDLTSSNGLSPAMWRQKFRTALRSGDIIQLARAGSVPASHIIPWALVYEIPMEPNHSQKPFKICRVVDEQWSSVDASRLPAYREQYAQTCPYAHEHETNVICPFGFWGYQYTLEQPISALHSRGWDIEPARKVLADVPIKMAVAATEDVPRQSRFKTHFDTIQQAISAEYIPPGLARERDEFRDSLRAPQLVYILCHGGKSGNLTYLSIGPRDNDAKHTITPDLPGNWGEYDYIDLEKWQETRPLVFINGCYTTDLLPDLTLNFVSAFRDLMVGGVIGTEIEVTVEFGYLAAERFFTHLGQGKGVGRAILAMRWDLLNQASFLGLAYTPYAMSDLRLERAPTTSYSPVLPPIVAPTEP